MKNTFHLLILVAFLSACNQPKKADLLVINAKIYTVNNSQKTATAFAIKDGMFIAVGNSETLTENYTATEVIDVKGKTIFPGFIDAHCHFLGMGLVAQKIRLEGTKSYDDVLEKLVAFQKEKKLSFITGEVGIKTIGK